MPPKTLYPQRDASIKVRTRDIKIVVCVSLVWVISFLFLQIFMTL